MDLLQSVVEIVMYGDKQDPHIFEYESAWKFRSFFHCCFLDEVLIIVTDCKCLDVSWNAK